MKNKKQLVDNPNKLQIFTGTAEKVKKDYEEFMRNFTDVILDTMMSGTPDNLVITVIYRKKMKQLYY